jgi:hypothetical protein
MTAAPKATTTDVATFTSGDVSGVLSRHEITNGITCHVGKISAKSAASVVAAAVMWLIVLAIITLV